MPGLTARRSPKPVLRFKSRDSNGRALRADWVPPAAPPPEPQPLSRLSFTVGLQSVPFWGAYYPEFDWFVPKRGTAVSKGRGSGIAPPNKK